MSTGMSVPKPRVSGVADCDSALLATLLGDAPVGLAFVGADLRLRRVNEVLARLSGIEQSGHVGRTPAQVWPEALAARAQAAVPYVLAHDQPLLETDQPVAIATLAVPGYWALSWYPSRDAETGVTGVALIAVDVTDRSNLQEAVRRSEERYRSLVQAGAQVVWVTTPAGEVAEDSPEWRSVTGQTSRSTRPRLAGRDSPGGSRAGRAGLAGVPGVGKVLDSRYRVRTKTGSYRHYDVRAVAIERDGQIVEWMGASTDVTAQREAEEMRGRLTEQLSAAALRTARLQQATSMLAEALTVVQVVEVITEVGRSAIGAERSAVAMLDPERLRLRTINLAGLPGTLGAPTGDMPLDVPSVMTAAIIARRPVLIESPDEPAPALRGPGECRLVPPAQRRAGLGGPAAAVLGGAAGRAAVLLHQAPQDHRGGAGLPRGAGRPVRAGPGARVAVRA